MGAAAQVEPRERARATGRCKHCGRHTYGNATACKSRLCRGYGPLWAGDWRRVLFDNLSAADALVGDEMPKGLDVKAAMLAVTAPGAELLPWDERGCRPLGPHKHSGKLGCRVDVAAAGEWNRTMDRRWSKLHRRAATEVRRKLGNDSVVLLTRGIELQHRGVKHAHPVLLAATPRQRAGAAAYRDRLELLAPQYGFGFVSQKIRPQHVKAAAAYLSSYFVTGKKEKAQLQHTVQHPAMRKSRLLWMTPRLTTLTGVTMRELRFRRYVWARFGMFAAAGGEWIDVARALAEIEQERGDGDLTADEIRDLVGQDNLNRWGLALLAQGKLKFGDPAPDD